MSTQDDPAADIFDAMEEDGILSYQNGMLNVETQLIAAYLLAQGWRPPMREITTVEELEALPNNEEMTIPQEAIEAAARVMKPRQFEPNYTPLGMWSDLEQMHEITELDCDMTRDRVRDILTAALPAIEKEIRAQVAAELRGELPVQLAENAQSPSGWLSDVEELHPKADPSHEYVWLMSYNYTHSLGSIDISHIATIDAQIAEGADHA